MLDTSTVLTVVIAVIIGLFIAVLIYLQQKIGVAAKSIDKDTKILKLQAYERLILLANRISIPNLITRLQNGSNAGELNRLLISFLGSDPAGDMHQLVTEVLSVEVKQIL